MRSPVRTAASALLLLAAASQFECGGTNNPTPEDFSTPVQDMATPDQATPDQATPDLLSAAPTIASITPASAANNVSTNVTISGANFRPGASVTIGGTACNNVVVV